MLYAIIIMLLALSVITLIGLATTVYCLHIYKCEFLQYTLLHLHIYTGGTHKVCPIHTRRLDLVG